MVRCRRSCQEVSVSCFIRFGSDMKKWPRVFLFLLALGVFIPMLVLVYTTSWQQTTSENNVNIGIYKGSRLMNETNDKHKNPLHNWMRSKCDALQLPQDQTMKIFTLNHIIVNHKHKVLYCQVPKVASTNWLRVFIFLSGKVKATNLMALKASDVHGQYDHHLTYLSDLNTDEIRVVIREYFKFIIVREPFERLLSAYRNKLEAQTNSSRFFHLRFGRKIIKRYRDSPSEQSLEKGNDVTFPEFVKYILDHDGMEEFNEHWAQLYNLCMPCVINYSFVGKYHRIQQDSKQILETINVADMIQFPPRSASYKHKKTEGLLLHYYKTIPRKHLQQLWKVYHLDFVLFNYTVPSSMQSLLGLVT
ncbi:carbohydrate sulfotransferase 11-like [Gigantopelta aegis]|uniref:carbohydrate sulfotransferase 11-like n=1 Tax=Gigantopelta aegis TaxID=1735272 RepID=UPI001B88C464|nr:carbohydrate sulfotransferase 11-like [Gigantopelta aegis]